MASRTADFYVREMNPPLAEGTVRTIWSLAKALSAFGWQVVVSNFRYSSSTHGVARDVSPCCSNFLFHEISFPFIQSGNFFEAERLPFSLLSAIFETLLAPRFLLNERRYRPDVIHIANCFKYCRLLWRIISATPYVLHLYQRAQIQPHLIPLAAHAQAIVASSKSVSQSICSRLGVEEARIERMFPPIDTDLFSPFDRQAAKALLGLKDKRVILYMGNLEHRRFPDRLIDLLSPVFKMHEDAFLLILTTPTRSNIGRVAQLNLVSKRCGVERSVRIAAKYLKEEEKSLLYRSCETFLFPPISFHAGAVEPPLTVLESLSSGLPVIATDVLSVGEVVTDGHNGFVVPIDKYDCLPYRVNRLLEMDPGQWQTLSVHARGAAVENFSLRSACKKFGNFNESLVG